MIVVRFFFRAVASLAFAATAIFFLIAAAALATAEKLDKPKKLPGEIQPEPAPYDGPRLHE